MNGNNKRKIATGAMIVAVISLMLSGAFALFTDSLTYTETITVEWVEIVDDSDSDLALEDVNDLTNTPITELTPGITYELTGTLENDSTNLTNIPGMTVTIADPDGEDTSTAVGEDIDVNQFCITVQVDQTVTPSTDLNLMIEFNANDAR